MRNNYYCQVLGSGSFLLSLGYGKQVFDTGLKLNMLQEFIMIPLDIFRRNMENKSIETHLEAWLTFLTNDNPERVIELIMQYPEFKPMYETVYQMCQNVERVMNMFSEELRILDRNTVKYMIEEQEQEIKRQKAELEEKDQQLNAYRNIQRNAIENLLKENMTVEKIAAILSCEVSYVEEIKREM